MQSTSADLLAKFLFRDNNLEASRKYFLIFDIDGTLRPDMVEALDHRHPKISAKTAKQLSELNTVPGLEVVILTARSYLDLFRSNFPRNIRKYCGCGRQIIDNDVLTYAREEFSRSYDETVMFIDLLKDLFGRELTAQIDFLVTPGDFALYFDVEDYASVKSQVLEKVNFLLHNSSRWKFTDFGKELIFLDTKYKYDKGDAVLDILDQTDLDTTVTHVFMFGDSLADYQAMKALRAYQVRYPSKKLKVSNVSVGPKLGEQPDIDFRFPSYTETLDFIDKLHSALKH